MPSSKLRYQEAPDGPVRVKDLGIVPEAVLLTRHVDATSVTAHVFVADRAYTVASIAFVISTAGGAGAQVNVRKILNASAPGAAAGANVVELLSAPLDLAGATPNTVVNGSLVGTAGVQSIAAGNLIAFNFGGTLTALVGLVRVVLVPA